MKFYYKSFLFCLVIALLFSPVRTGLTFSLSPEKFFVPEICYNFSDQWPSISRSSKYYRVICQLKEETYIQKTRKINSQSLSSFDEYSTIQSSIQIEHECFLQSIHPSVSYTILGEWSKTYNGFALLMRGYSIPSLTSNQYINKIYLDKDEYFPVRDIAIETIRRDEIKDFYEDKPVLPVIPDNNLRIGIVDTGIDYNHDDFYPKGFKEDHSKIQGGWDCYHILEEDEVKEGIRPGDPDPMDDNYRTGGHGTHVAGIAAGNNPSHTYFQGMCPNASLYAYKVFPSKVSGGAPSYTIISAAEYATQDRCSVINLSLGHEGEIPSIEKDSPYYDSLHNAREAGVMIIASAGNDGSRTEFNPWPLHAPGVFDSTLQVGATDDRIIQSFRICNPISRKTYFGQSSRFALSFNSTFNGKEIVYCGFGSEDECKKTDLKGKIALVKRGPKDNGISFHDKNLNAKHAGAIGCIIFNYNSNSFSPNLFPENVEKPYSEDFIPCMMISKELEQELHTIVDGLGYIEFLEKQSTVASYTSAGPCYSSDNGFFKPELCAPGTSIYSSVPNFKEKTGSSWSKKQGTSMATPIVTGCAALLRYNYPDFSIDAIESLLMNTANLIKNPVNNNYISFMYQGSGEIDLKQAMETPIYADPKYFIVPEEKNSDPLSFTLHNFSNKPISVNVYTEVLSNKNYANSLVGVFDKPFVTIDPDSDETIQCWLYKNDEIQQDFLEGVIWIEVIGDTFIQDQLLHIPFVYKTDSLLKIKEPIYDVDYSLTLLDMKKENFGFIRFSLASGSIYRDVFFDKGSNDIIRKKDKVRNLAEQVYINIYDGNDNIIDSIFFGDNIPIGNYQILWNGLDAYQKQFLPNGQYYLEISIPLHYRYYSVVQNEDEPDLITYTGSEDRFIKSDKVHFEITNSSLPKFPKFILCSPQKVKDTGTFIIEFQIERPYNGSNDVTVVLDPLLQVVELHPSLETNMALQKETNSIRMKTDISSSFIENRYSFGQIYVKITTSGKEEYKPTFFLDGYLSYKYPLENLLHKIHTPIVTTLPFILGDFNNNGEIDFEDYSLLKKQLGKTDLDSSWISVYDIFQDGIINVKDLWYMVRK